MKLINIQNCFYDLETGKFLDEEELEFYMSLETKRDKSPSIYQLMQYYPSAKNVALKYVRDKIKRKKRIIDKIITYRDEQMALLELEKDIIKRTNTQSWIMGVVEDEIDELREEIEKLEKDRKYLVSLIKPNDNYKNIINADIISKAKQVPISDYIDIGKNGKAKCLFHDDRNPSMHIYKDTNTFFCFTCSAAGTVIDIVMKLWGLDFVGAVRRLYEKNI